MEKLKILYITGGGLMDYMNCMIFHGLVSLGHEVTDTNRLWYLEKGFDQAAYKSQYGGGFTMCNTLPNRANIDRNNIEDRIRAKEFDLVVYGQIWRCQDYYDLVYDVYNESEIAFVDGDDHPGIIGYMQGAKIPIFKRECVMTESFAYARVFPIEFCIPEEKIFTGMIEKQKPLSCIIPWLPSAHQYTEEEDYYNEYRHSWFAITMRKCGWDCMRHYEIAANGCLPYFSAFDSMPRNTMIFWPATLQSDANHLFREWSWNGMFEEDYVKYNMRLENYLVRAQHLINAFMEEMHEKLTTKAVANYMIKTISRY